MISFFEENVKTPKFCKRKASAWIKEVAKNQGFKVGDVSYIFCSDEKILEINKQYLQHDYYTDIITFDYTENQVINGDIFISVDTVKSNSEQFKTDFKEELFRIIIHGIHHLCGQEDKKPEDRTEMTRKENESLQMLSQFFDKKE